jgi:hypothetical protein
MLVEAGALQSRCARVSDRFKAAWTAQQVVAGIAQHFFQQASQPVADFPALSERIRSITAALNGTWPSSAGTAIDNLDEELDGIGRQLVGLDARISPSFLRRFCERLDRPEPWVFENLIRFYFYADAVEGDTRDKIDFLITRLGEEFDPGRGEYVIREALSLRQRIVELVTLLRVGTAPRAEVIQLIRALRSMRQDIESADHFDDLTERNLLKDARTFKHRVGDLYFDPDVLLAVVELNVATKNRFLRLYSTEERRLMDDADKLLAHADALQRNFGKADHALAADLYRFRDIWERFGVLRAEGNVKHEVVAQLKNSINDIMSRLDRGIEPEIELPEVPQAFFDDARQLATASARFGRDEPLLPFVLRIVRVFDPFGDKLTPQELLSLPDSRDLRLEAWEAAAFLKLFERLPAEDEDDAEELWFLYVRAAALRMKIDEEATILSTTIAAGVTAEKHLLSKCSQSLELAKELDVIFGDLLQEAAYYPNRNHMRQLYRSRFRLLRGFSGLWLIYDRQT